MIAAERKLYIMKQLQEKTVINLKQMAVEIGASEITIRRDLEKLENAGKLVRVPGGAMLEQLDSAEMTMREKESINSEEKHMVAEHVAKLIKPGECIFLDGGTSIAPVIEYIADMEITIVTYNLLILRKLINPVAKIHIIGGLYLPYFGMNVGPEAQESTKNFHYDRAIIGCSGISLEHGLSYITNLDSMLIKKIAMESSDKSYLLIDSTKLEKPSFLKFEELEAFDEVFCNQPEKAIKDKRITFI